MMVSVEYVGPGARAGMHLVKDSLGAVHEVPAGLGFPYEPGRDYAVIAPGGKYQSDTWRLVPYRTLNKFVALADIAKQAPATALRAYALKDAPAQGAAVDQVKTIKAVDGNRAYFAEGGCAVIPPGKQGLYQPGNTVALVKGMIDPSLANPRLDYDPTFIDNPNYGLDAGAAGHTPGDPPLAPLVAGFAGSYPPVVMENVLRLRLTRGKDNTPVTDADNLQITIQEPDNHGDPQWVAVDRVERDVNGDWLVVFPWDVPGKKVWVTVWCLGHLSTQLAPGTGRVRWRDMYKPAALVPATGAYDLKIHYLNVAYDLYFNGVKFVDDATNSTAYRDFAPEEMYIIGGGNRFTLAWQDKSPPVPPDEITETPPDKQYYSQVPINASPFPALLRAPGGTYTTVPAGGTLELRAAIKTTVPVQIVYSTAHDTATVLYNDPGVSFPYGRDGLSSYLLYPDRIVQEFQSASLATDNGGHPRQTAPAIRMAGAGEFTASLSSSLAPQSKPWSEFDIPASIRTITPWRVSWDVGDWNIAVFYEFEDA